MSQLNLDLYEKIIAFNCLKSGNEEYLATIIDYLDPNIFKNRDVSTFISLIKEFYLEHNTIPNQTEIKSKIVNNTLLESFKRLIDEFKQLDTKYTIGELVKNTETFIKQRTLLQTIEKSVDEFSIDKNIDENRILKDFNKIQTISLVDNLGMDFVNDTDSFINKLKQKDDYISTGYVGLDRELNGGLFKEGKSIYGFAGETNVGKSIVLGNIATNVFLQSYNVVIISLEMSEFRYAKRLASMMTGIKQVELSTKTDEYLEFINNYNENNKGRLFIKEFPTKQVSAKHLAGYLGQLERKRGFVPNVIITDYHTLLRPSVPQGSKHADMQFITQETRALSYLFPASVITAAQLNRSEGSEIAPGLGRIAGSWDMLSDLDYLINIWQTDEDREAELLRWETKKGRDSTKNISHFWSIDYSTLRLKDEEEEINNSYYINNMEGNNVCDIVNNIIV